MNLGSRLSPSGPKFELQLPFYGANAPASAAGVYYVKAGGVELVADGDDVEVLASFMMPQRGNLGTFLVKNVLLGDDPVSISYQVRREKVGLGSAIVLPNTASGPMRVDLSKYSVNTGNLLSIQAVLPAGILGVLPVPKLLLTWFPGAPE